MSRMAQEPLSDRDGAIPGARAGAGLDELIDGTYRVLSPLESSLTGRSYLAQEMATDRMVVLKLMHTGTNVRSRHTVERFRAEARALARLEHPNIARLLFYGNAVDGRPYLVTEHTPGTTLDRLLAEFGWLPQARALRILDQVAAALEEAHQAGLVHRNLKPKNVLVQQLRDGSERVKLTNFGLVLAPAEAGMGADITTPGEICGSPPYLSPEQARGRTVIPASDIYGVGVLAYKMMTGRLPFEAGSPLGYAYQHAVVAVAPPSKRFRELRLEPACEELLIACLEKDPVDRPASATALRRMIQRALRAVEGEPTVSDEVPAAAPATREMDFSERPPWLFPALLAGGSLLIGLLLGALL
jgi:serine/threonine-protein kinase